MPSIPTAYSNDAASGNMEIRYSTPILNPYSPSGYGYLPAPVVVQKAEKKQPPVNYLVPLGIGLAAFIAIKLFLK